LYKAANDADFTERRRGLQLVWALPTDHGFIGAGRVAGWLQLVYVVRWEGAKFIRGFKV
jgi:hypothetical protein